MKSRGRELVQVTLSTGERAFIPQTEVGEMHVNVCTIVGRVSKRGPKLDYSAGGTPICSLVVEVEELGKAGATFTTYLPIEISGRYAERVAGDLEAGDEVMISGKLKYKSTVDPKTQQKTSKLIISTWGIQQRIPALAGVPQADRSDASEGQRQEETPARTPRKRPYPRAALGGGFQN